MCSLLLLQESFSKTGIHLYFLWEGVYLYLCMCLIRKVVIFSALTFLYSIRVYFDLFFKAIPPKLVLIISCVCLCVYVCVCLYV